MVVSALPFLLARIREIGREAMPYKVETAESRPFYYTSHEPANRTDFDCYYAPSGWYQWTKSGLKYLGESILENQ